MKKTSKSIRFEPRTWAKVAASYDNLRERFGKVSLDFTVGAGKLVSGQFIIG